MKKSTILKIAFLALPLAVVAIAIRPGSVTVIQGTEIRYTNFMEAVVGSSVGWCAPVALILTYFIFGMAVFYLLTKKEVLLKLVRSAAFVGTCLLGCPILVRNEMKVIPKVFAAILMLALWVLSRFVVADQKKAQEVAPKGRRLSGR